MEFANPGSKRGLLRLLARKAALRLTGGGRRLRLYGTNTWRYDRRPLLRDWRALFTLLAEGRISPVVARTFPLSEAAAGRPAGKRHGDREPGTAAVASCVQLDRRTCRDDPRQVIEPAGHEHPCCAGFF